MTRRLSLFDSPFLLGFDQFERALDRAQRAATEGYPPYNIEQVSDTLLRITIAVAGTLASSLGMTLKIFPARLIQRTRPTLKRVFPSEYSRSSRPWPAQARGASDCARYRPRRATGTPDNAACRRASKAL